MRGRRLWRWLLWYDVRRNICCKVAAKVASGNLYKRESEKMLNGYISRCNGLSHHWDNDHNNACQPALLPEVWV